jgi:hypothetical protein
MMDGSRDIWIAECQKQQQKELPSIGFLPILR